MTTYSTISLDYRQTDRPAQTLLTGQHVLEHGVPRQTLGHMGLAALQALGRGHHFAADAGGSVVRVATNDGQTVLEFIAVEEA